MEDRAFAAAMVVAPLVASLSVACWWKSPTFFRRYFVPGLTALEVAFVLMLAAYGVGQRDELDLVQNRVAATFKDQPEVRLKLDETLPSFISTGAPDWLWLITLLLPLLAGSLTMLDSTAIRGLDKVTADEASQKAED